MRLFLSVRWCRNGGCAGTDENGSELSWDGTKWAIAETDTSNSCVSIDPMDASPAWVDDDDLPENRVRPCRHLFSLSLFLTRNA